MQPLLEIKAFFFNAKTDYLPYYKNFSIELTDEMNVQELLALIKGFNEDFTYPSENLFLKINNTIVDAEQNISEVVVHVGTSLKIDPINAFRSNNGLVINDSDFMQTYELLAPFATEEDLAYYQTLYSVHYASETEKFDHTYIGDAILLLAHKMITNGSEHKEEILHAITSGHSSLFDCEYENNFFHVQDHTVAITELKEMVKPSSDDSSFLDKITARFTKKEQPKERSSVSIEGKKIAYYVGNVTDNAQEIKRKIAQVDAEYIEFSRANKLSGLTLLSDNKKLALTKAGTTLLDALDSGAQILVVEDTEAYTMFKEHFHAIEVTVGRDIDMELITAKTFLTQETVEETTTTEA
ncbi:MAG: hypothetical protein U9O24_10490 [Campylobacterota bacterium]|nr:hypothetical protein [Campylobacterota bacterium]